MNQTTPLTVRWAFWLACATAVTTLVLLIAGGLVTSQDVGMAVPDWPTTYGQNMFTFPLSRMVGGVGFEHTHRLLGSLVGLLTVVLSLVLWKFDARRWVKILGAVAVLAVAVQGFLGGFRVLLDERLLAVVHGSLAHAFFALVTVLAAITSASWLLAPADLASRGGASLRQWAVTTAIAAYSQIVLGAVLRHTGNLLELHLLLAFAVPALTFPLVERIRQAVPPDDVLARRARTLGRLVGTQLALGLLAYVAKRISPVAAEAPIPVVLVTVAHQVTGALILATVAAMALLIHHRARLAAPHAAASLEVVVP